MRYFIFILAFSLFVSCGAQKNIPHKTPKLFHKSYKTTKEWPYHKPIHHQKSRKMMPLECPAMH